MDGESPSCAYVRAAVATNWDTTSDLSLKRDSSEVDSTKEAERGLCNLGV